MTAHRIRYYNGTSALRPECSRYRNENERINRYSSAAHEWDRGSYRRSSSTYRPAPRKDSIRDVLSNAVEDSHTMRDLRAGKLAGSPVNKADTWKMSWYAAAYTLIALVAIVGVAL